MKKYPQKFLDLLNSITAKRPQAVIQHLLKHGRITTDEILEEYGYKHAPRAVRDVRERGIPIVTRRIKSEDGRSIAIYELGSPEDAQYRISSKKIGRTVFSKVLKKVLVEKYGSKCFIYLEKMEERLLQIDHRVPYEIGGDVENENPDAYMLLCPSANRAKSWTCEHCVNWERKNVDFCLKCFWAFPENYEHIAGKKEKVICLRFTGDEIQDFVKLVELSGIEEAQKAIKKWIHEHLQ